MARDARDVVSLAKILLGSSDLAPGIRSDISEEPKAARKELSIGILDSEWGTDPNSKWKWGSDEVV
jgi:hypothetical protein